jgi:hypothetical protein
MRSLVQERLEDHEDQDNDQEQKEQVQEEPEKKQQTDPKLEAARLRLGEIASSLKHLKGQSHDNDIF